MKVQTKPEVLTARFRALKLRGAMGGRVLQGCFQVELTPVPGALHLYTVAIEGGGKPFAERKLTLPTAKEQVRLMFVEQVNEWRPRDRV